MRRLVVHVGPPKSATTNFQHDLFSNAGVLAAHGVYLPEAGRLEFEPNAVCHHHLAWELMGSPRFRSDIGGWDALALELADVDAETVVLSSEELGRAILSEGLQEELNRRLLALGRAVTILYVVRDQLSQINSYYAQQVKLLQNVPPFGPYVSKLMRRDEANLARNTRAWYRSSGFDFVAVPFPELEKPNPLVALFRAAHVAIPEDELNIDPNILNITLGPIAVEAIRLLRIYLRVS